MLLVKHKDQNASDEELIQRFCIKNDLEVLGVLYNRYLHLVYGVCLKYLKNREDSQDAVMQIFEILIKEIPKHEIRVFKSWLHGVSRNFCLMKLRKETSLKNKKISFSETVIVENEEQLHPIDSKESTVKTKLLAECLKTLKKEQKQSVELFYYSKQCYREIAEELKIEEKKVKSFIQNGKRNLKLCLERNKKGDE